MMQQLLYLIKEQINILSLLIVLLIIAAVFYKRGRLKTANWLLGIVVVVFLVCSTNYLPQYLAAGIEKKYACFKQSAAIKTNQVTYIHILGSGTSADSARPAGIRLCAAATGRMLEALRVYRLLDSAKIIASGGTLHPGRATQAAVVKLAATEMGIPAKNIIRLDQPLTTAEEAEALKSMMGNGINLIVVTDAIHMPRAMQIFEKLGFHPIAAPTNFYTALQISEFRMRWWPSLENLHLMDVVLHEFLGQLKQRLLN